MQDVPLEVIYRHAFREASDYFAKKIEEKRRDGYVAVVINDFVQSLYFMKCNNDGYPEYHHFKYASLDPITVTSLFNNVVPEYKQITVEEITVVIEKPLLSYRYDYNGYPVVFLWEGRKMQRDKVPLEKFNVSELMKIAQQAIINREGLVIDEALKNKIYK